MSRQRLSGFRPWSHQQHLPSSPGPSKELCNHIVGGVGGGVRSSRHIANTGYEG